MACGPRNESGYPWEGGVDNCPAHHIHVMVEGLGFQIQGLGYTVWARHIHARRAVLDMAHW
ncbi:MAG: hypothetical protein ACK55Z_33460 [bacterium]